MSQEQDRTILRELAKRQLEISQSVKTRSGFLLWKAHNAFQPSAPVVHVEIDTFEQEILPSLLRCEGGGGTGGGTGTVPEFLNLELFDDDWVVRTIFRWSRAAGSVLLDTRLPVLRRQIRPETGWVTDFIMYWRICTRILKKLTPSEFGFDGAFYQRKERFAQEMFGDILPVRRTMNGLYAVPTQDGSI